MRAARHTVRDRLLLGAALIVIVALLLLAAVALRPSPADVLATTDVAAPVSNLAADAALESVSGGTQSEPSARERIPASSPTPAPTSRRSLSRSKLVGFVRSTDAAIRKVNSGSVSLTRDPNGPPREPADAFAALHGTHWGAIRPDGAFTIENVPAGYWIARAESDGFEINEMPVLIGESESTGPLNIALVPASPVELVLVLRHPSGISLFDAVERPDLKKAEALAPVFLEECPAIGADLPSSVRRLVQRSRHVRFESPDQWMIASFKRPTAGCVAVVLGARVLAAVPFAKGQQVVVLSVDPALFAPQLCTLDILVRDTTTGLPIEACHVSVSPHDGQTRTATTGARGEVRFVDLVAGRMRITSGRTGYATSTGEVHVSAGVTTAPHTVDLHPTITVSGRVRFPPSGPIAHSVAAWLVRSGSRLQADIRRSAFDAEPEFSIQGLAPGEYLIGVSQFETGVPTMDNVRSGQAAGWKVVELGRGTVPFVELEITEELAALLRGASSQRR